MRHGCALRLCCLFRLELNKLKVNTFCVKCISTMKCLIVFDAQEIF